VKILLILNKGEKADMKFMVKLNQQKLIKKVQNLLAQKRQKEVFDLLMARGEVCEYIPAGKKIPLEPEHILVEDILQL
jgi:hypothetical protein